MISRSHPLDSLVSETAPNGLAWEEWETLAELTGHVDWGCDFVEGYCYVNHKKLEYAKQVGCLEKYGAYTNCCAACASSRGFLGTINPQHLEKIKSLYDKNNRGFFRDNGCVLPRELRSRVCLTQHCKRSPATVSLFELFYKKFKDPAELKKEIEKIKIKLKKEGRWRDEVLS